MLPTAFWLVDPARVSSHHLEFDIELEGKREPWEVFCFFSWSRSIISSHIVNQPRGITWP